MDIPSPWLTILTSGAVAAVVSWLLNLLRDKRATDTARLDKHRDNVQAAVADFLAIEHARHHLDVELTKDQDVVTRGVDTARPDYKPSAQSARIVGAEERIRKDRPTLLARRLEAEQAAARVELLDPGLGTLARAVVGTNAPPNYPPRPESASDKYAEALKELHDATRKILDVPGA